MCRFKSGIILKTRCVVADGADDSHSELLRKLGIEDTTENAITKFVRVELVPPDDAWWTDPGAWIINVDQDLLPDWFNDDREKYCEDFREVVKEWCNVHVVMDKEIDTLSHGYYRLKGCKIKKLCNDVTVMCDSSTIARMYDSSKVAEMYGSSSIARMYGSSKVAEMYGSSSIARMYGSSMAVQYKKPAEIKIIVPDNSINVYKIVNCKAE